MNADPEVQRYIQARKRFYDGLESKKVRLDQLLQEMSQRPTSIDDATTIDELHREKNRLFIDFMRTEDAFVNHLVEAFKSAT